MYICYVTVHALAKWRVPAMAMLTTAHRRRVLLVVLFAGPQALLRVGGAAFVSVSVVLYCMSMLTTARRQLVTLLVIRLFTSEKEANCCCCLFCCMQTPQARIEVSGDVFIPSIFNCIISLVLTTAHRFLIACSLITNAACLAVCRRGRPWESAEMCLLLVVSRHTRPP